MTYTPDERFEDFLEALRKRSAAEWAWLVGRFRLRLIGWLHKKTLKYAADLLLSRSQFVEEVFEEVLLKFYELFPNGSFKRYADLEALVVTVAGYKLKENLARAQRERRLLQDREWLAKAETSAPPPGAEAEEEMLVAVTAALQKIDPEEKSLLLRYFAGEELQEIATAENISPEACRKRKQRALEKLKSFVFNTIKNPTSLLWPILMLIPI